MNPIKKIFYRSMYRYCMSLLTYRTPRQLMLNQRRSLLNEETSRLNGEVCNIIREAEKCGEITSHELIRLGEVRKKINCLTVKSDELHVKFVNVNREIDWLIGQILKVFYALNVGEIDKGFDISFLDDIKTAEYRAKEIMLYTKVMCDIHEKMKDKK